MGMICFGALAFIIIMSIMLNGANKEYGKFKAAGMTDGKAFLSAYWLMLIMGIGFCGIGINFIYDVFIAN